MPAFKIPFSERPETTLASNELQRFDARYWTINFNTEMASTVVAMDWDALRVTCDYRTTRDLCGLFWWSIDYFSHTSYRYSTNFDYNGSRLEFDFRMTNMMPLTDVNGASMTVIQQGGAAQYVRLANYITSGDGLAGHIVLNFSAVKAGFSATETINWATVDHFFIGLIHTSYNAANPSTPIGSRQVATFEMTNIVVTGPTLSQLDRMYAAHTLRMTDGFDDSYVITPSRFIDQLYRLGYRVWYSIYMGISHYHDQVWDGSRFVVNPNGDYVNAPTKAWFGSLLSELERYGYTKCVISLSYEIVNYLMPNGWQQFDKDGNPGLSGWSPPSMFMTPCNPAPLNYLVHVANAIFDLFPNGVEKWFQVGEPWWWDNSFTTHQPCFYDNFTTAAYPAETGLPVPVPYLSSTTQPITGYEDYLAFLNYKLGASTQYIRDQIKITHPTIHSTFLIYTPQVFATEMLTRANLPINYWQRGTGWEICQIEDYDWVQAGEWEKIELTFNTAKNLLGYPETETHYFSGFVLNPADAATLWPNIIQGAENSMARGIEETWVWARPQVFRDNIRWPYTYTYVTHEIILHAGSTSPFVFPSDWTPDNKILLIGSGGSGSNGGLGGGDGGDGGDTIGVVDTYLYSAGQSVTFHISTSGSEQPTTFDVYSAAGGDSASGVDAPPPTIPNISVSFPLGWLKEGALGTKGNTGDVAPVDPMHYPKSY